MGEIQEKALISPGTSYKGILNDMGELKFYENTCLDMAILNRRVKMQNNDSRSSIGLDKQEHQRGI